MERPSANRYQRVVHLCLQETLKADLFSLCRIPVAFADGTLNLSFYCHLLSLLLLILSTEVRPGS